MDRARLIIVILLVVFSCTCGVLLLQGPARESLRAMLTKAETERMVAQAVLTSAKADERQAEANYAEAQGDLELKRGQAEALTETVGTSNGILKWCSVIYPAAPPLYTLMGVVLGGLAVGGIAYAIGYRNGVGDTRPVAPEPTVSPRVPKPEVVGG